jgi:hypothetical protein
VHIARIAATITMTKQMDARVKVIIGGMGRKGPAMNRIMPMIAKATAT